MEVTADSKSPRTTIVVVPRDRFDLAVCSLDSMLESTREPFELIYVDAGSPPAVQAAIEKRVREVGGTLLRMDAPMPPNAARNLALPHVNTDYILFMDNDVLVEEGWLGSLVACADETGAGVVGPLTMIDLPSGTFIHLVGGELELQERDGVRTLHEHHIQRLESLEALDAELQPKKCGFAEFHTMLVRRSALDALGPLDEGFVSAMEHLDLGLLMKEAGHSVYVEPRSKVTYVQPHVLPLSERAFFLERWSDEWNSQSIDHFAKKWDIDRACSSCENTQNFAYEHQALCPLPLHGRAGSERLADPVAHGYAQTPAQLYQQLRACGFGDQALVRMQRSCDQAISLFAEIFRACGKPFLCHGIGTASVLLRHGAPLALAQAGVLHGAYSHGRFPEFKHRRSRQRKLIKRAVGGGTEALIHRHHEYDWGAGPPTTELAELDCADAGIFLLRMANDLEEQLDLSLAYTSKSPELAPEWQPFFRSLADELGLAGLAKELERASEATRAQNVPAVLRHQGARSYAINPWTRERESVGRRPKIAKSKWRRRLAEFGLSRD